MRRVSKFATDSLFDLRTGQVPGHGAAVLGVRDIDDGARGESASRGARVRQHTVLILMWRVDGVGASRAPLREIGSDRLVVLLLLPAGGERAQHLHKLTVALFGIR